MLSQESKDNGDVLFYKKQNIRLETYFNAYTNAWKGASMAKKATSLVYKTTGLFEMDDIILLPFLQERQKQVKSSSAAIKNFMEQKNSNFPEEGADLVRKIRLNIPDVLFSDSECIIFWKKITNSGKEMISGTKQRKKEVRKE